MGTVYLARQIEPIEREVAIKLIKLGMDSREVLSRFRYERQALALMDHPNIARIYDAGASADGRPYFAMEYIDGEPITKYCDDRRLSVRARLELMVQVCDAVRHAHQRGLLHRDLKPGNILVAERDGQPVPKVIDFGVARAIQPGDDSVTRLGQFVGTPEYMSPEQADYLFADVDTTTDVYSLGVVTYELLSGELPFGRRKARRASNQEMLRLISEEDAEPLSDRIASLGDSATELAERRDTDAASLLRQVSGDVSWVVMKALERPRERRYPSVFELMCDLRRCLNDEPVHAAPPSQWYLFAKFIRRNRAIVLMAAAVAAALAGGTTAALWQARVATQQRGVAERAQSIAESRAREAELQRVRAAFQESQSEAHLEDVRKLASSMLFDLDDQVRFLSGGTTARQTLVRLGMEYLQKAQTPKDSRLAAAYYRIGELQGLDGLRDLSGARSSYERSILLAERQLTAQPNDPSSRLTLALAFSRLSEIEWNPYRAVDLRQKSRATIRALARERSNDTASQQALAEISIQLGTPDDLRQSITVSSTLLRANANDPRLLWLQGRALVQSGYLSELQTSDVPRIAEPETPSCRYLAECLRNVESGLQSLRLAASLQPANAAYQLSLVEGERLLAQLLVRQNHVRDGLAQAEHAWSIMDSLAAADRENSNLQVQFALTQLEVGTLMQRLGKTSTADQYLQQATRRLREQSSAHPQNLDLQLQVAEALRMIGGNESLLSGRHSLAQQVQEEALAILQELARMQPGNAEISHQLVLQEWAVSDTARKGGNLSRALAASRSAVQRLGTSKDLPKEYLPLLLSEARFQLAQSLSAAGQGGEAVHAVEEAIAIRRAIASRRIDRRVLEMQIALAEWQQRRNHFAETKNHARDALAGLRELATRRGMDLATARALKDASSWLMATVSVEEQLELAHQTVETVRILVNAEPRGPQGRLLQHEALIIYSRALRNSGRQTEFLNTARRAIAVLDYVPAESIEAIDTRLSFFEAYLEGQRNLQQSGYSAEAARVCLRVLPWVENLSHAEPDLHSAWTMLHRFYGQTADAHSNSGDAETTIKYQDLQLRTLKQRESSLTAQDWIDIGLKYAQLGWSDARRRQLEDGKIWWRQAIEAFERGVDRAGQPTANIDSAKLHERAHHWRAYVHEALRDYPAAITHRESALRHAEWFCGKDPSVDVCRWKPETNSALLFRTKLLALGKTAQPKTPMEWRDLGLACRTVAADSFQIASPPSERWEAAQQALTIFRKLARDEPTRVRRNELGGTLVLATEVALSIGRGGRGRPANVPFLTAAIQLAVDAENVLDALEREESNLAWRGQHTTYIRNLETQAREALRAAGGH